MEFLPVLQGLSTPILIILGIISYRGMVTLHDIDKRVAIIESKLDVGVKNDKTSNHC